ncbi:MAG: alpha/beta hydrolase [Nitratireductor sp.]|nr:alpha/beta hydrolase [Nitratireductor sp.]
MLIASPSYNPAPAHAADGKVTTPDGIELRYARWRTVNAPCKGTVLLLHGRAEYIEKLYETTQDLLDAGFDVLSFDWRGQGGSDRLLEDVRKGFVEHFDQYVQDLETVLDAVALPDCRPPYYLLAHSTGALVALLAAPRLGNRVRRMVLLSPLLKLGSLPVSQSYVKWLTGALHVMGLGQLYVGGGATPDQKRKFSGNVLTSDLERFQRNARFAAEFTDQTIGGPTASWLFAAIRAMDRVNQPDFHGSITIPTLILCAGNDKVVDNEAAEHLGRRLRSGSCLIIPGARHEMQQERDVVREQVLASFKAFVPGSGEEESLTLRQGRKPAVGSKQSA